MQNRYAADIGDYVKLALLRHLGAGRNLGVAWYLYPDEGHNSDGKHISYLKSPARWRHLDPELFDALEKLVDTERSVKAIERSGILAANYSGEVISSSRMPWPIRSSWRTSWFDRVMSDLQEADLIFADPDNGLVDDDPRRRSRKVFGKQMPLAEANALAKDRTAIIYHHNTRRAGGHDAEVDHWISQLGPGTAAIRATAFSCRTFFILNPDEAIMSRASSFCDRWAEHRVRLHRS